MTKLRQGRSEYYGSIHIYSDPPGAFTRKLAFFEYADALVVSNSHKWPLGRRDRGRLNSGGGFLKESTYTIARPNYIHIRSNPPDVPGIYQEYQGPDFAFVDQLTLSGYGGFTISPESESSMSALGSIGVRKSIPTQPMANFGQFLGELGDVRHMYRDLNPHQYAKAMLDEWNNRLRRSRLAADKWLSTQFGWIPFVNDLCDLVVVTRNADARIAQYQRDSGRNIHRRRKILNTTSTTITELGTGYPAMTTTIVLWQSPGVQKLTVTKHKSVWFSGCFTYYLPPVTPGFWGQGKRITAEMDHLFGIRPTPDLVWNLTPWSWLSDWMTQSGPLIDNWSRFHTGDNLVMRYGYVMSHSTELRTIDLIGCKPRYSYGGSSSYNFSQSFVKEVKQRSVATPYGFGLNPLAFSNRQWSIIAALGISKRPRAYVD